MSPLLAEGNPLVLYLGKGPLLVMEILRQLYPGLPKRALSLGVEDRLEEDYKAMGILLDSDRVSIYINIFATAKVIEE